MCAGCGDSTRPIAVQAGRVVVCDRCQSGIPALVLNADGGTLEALFGCRPPRLRSAEGDARAHLDLAVAFEKSGLEGDAILEFALAALAGADDGDADEEACVKLLERLVARNTLGAAAREVDRRRRLAS
ncbi:MAG: hypothetical protein JNL79_32115 [Myxococcales bacterium]|nr:hypothetical protein [Myxococcales bacterium]